MLRKAIFTLLVIVLSLGAITDVQAQCAMCTANAEQGVKNGNTQTVGQNKGVLYLLALPFLMVSGVGFIWYTNYRKKPSSLSVD